MSPFITNGDVVKVVPAEGKINLGDIVLYLSSYGNVTVHRVIRKRKEGVIIKGDSVPSPDQLVPSEQILGRVVSVEKDGWRISLDKPIGRVINSLFATISPFSFLTYPLLKFMRPADFVVLSILRRLPKF